MVNVANGVNDMNAELEGQTVAQVRAQVSKALNVDPQATARVNGENVSSDYVLCSDDSLEFVKSSGVKG